MERNRMVQDRHTYVSCHISLRTCQLLIPRTEPYGVPLDTRWLPRKILHDVFSFNLIVTHTPRQVFDYQLAEVNLCSPLDTDWEIWTAGIVTDTATRDIFISSVKRYASDGLSSQPFGDWYETTNGGPQGFRARPVVGGHLGGSFLFFPVVDSHILLVALVSGHSPVSLRPF